MANGWGGDLKGPEHRLPTNPDQRVVLVADDEVLVVNIVRNALETEGYFVLAAENGEVALELSRKFPGIIHLLVSDVKMPRMDGIELRKRILEERPGIKVLLMSGTANQQIEGCPFLKKPFHVAALKERVRHLLAKTISG